jgi:trigger factor
MAEENAAVAENAQGTEEAEFVYPITVEDAGPATKKVTVEIPQDRIRAKLDEQFTTLRKEAHLPGFRPGHAPRKLIERKFASNVRDEVRNSLLRESYQQAVEKNNLQVIGEPDFDNAEKLDKLPDEGAFTYTFSVEVQPEFALPDLGALTVKKPKIAVTDEHVQQALKNLREQQGTLTPVEDRGVEAGDYLIADVHLKVDGNVVAHQHDANLIARPGAVGGLKIDDFDTQIAGTKAGEAKTITVKAPDNHPNEQIKGKDVGVEVKVKEIKKLQPAEIDEAFLEDLGFANQQELLDALREQMVERIDNDVKGNVRQQVAKYLVDNTTIELPAKMSDRQTDRIVQRRATQLLSRGVPIDQIRANVEVLKQGAADEGLRELKLFFILQKVATDKNIDVDEAELNGQIAMIAIQRGQRPETLKKEMQSDGSLANLYVQLREQKALDALLEGAKVEEVELKEGEQASGEAAPAGESSST